MPKVRTWTFSHQVFDQWAAQDAARHPIACGTSQESDTPEKADLRERLYDAMEDLTDREQYVLQALFFEKLSLRQVAARLSLSHVQMLRIRDKALERLRVALVEDEAA